MGGGWFVRRSGLWGIFLYVPFLYAPSCRLKNAGVDLVLSPALFARQFRDHACPIHMCLNGVFSAELSHSSNVLERLFET